MVFEVTKILPARTPAFEEIKDRVATEFKNQRAGDILRRKALEMADRAHAEHDLSKAAKEAGATFKTSELVGTHPTSAGDRHHGGAGRTSAFSMKPGEISGPLNIGRRPGGAANCGAARTLHLRSRVCQATRSTAGTAGGTEKTPGSLDLFMSDLGARLEKEGKMKINKTEMDSLTKSRS